MRTYLFSFLSLLFIYPFGQLSAQEYTVSVQQFGIEEGLVHRIVRDVYKDKNGFLWILGYFTPLRYDGYEFKSYPFELSTGRTLNIGEDEEGWIWMVQENGASAVSSLFFLNSLTGENLKKEDRLGCETAAQLDILLNREAYHFYCDKKKGEKEKWYFGGRDHIMLFDVKTGLEKISFPNTGTEPIHIALIDSKGNFWIHGENGLIRKLSADGVQLDSIKITDHILDKSFCFKANTFFEWQGHVYVRDLSATKNQLIRIADSGEKKLIFEDPDGYCFFEFLEGQIWCLGSGGWKVFNTEGALMYELKRKDYDQKLFKVFDAGGIISDGTGKFYLNGPMGFNIIEVHKNPFIHYFFEDDGHPLPINNEARGIYAQNDSIVVNFENGGLVLFKKDTPKKYNILSTKAKIPYKGIGIGYDGISILRDASKNFWVGHGNYLKKWSPNFSSSKQIPFSRPIQSPTTWSIWEDKSGCTWYFTTHGLGKNCLDEGIPTEFLYKDVGFEFNNNLLIYHVQPDEKGLLWLSSAQGIYLFDTGQKKVVAHYHTSGQGEYHLPVNTIYFMHQGTEGNRWLGTASGLLFWNTTTGEKRLFKREDGLINEIILSVYEDNYNRLWLSSDYGIMSFHKETFEVQAYLVKDGITNIEFNRISHFQEPDGTIYFGGTNGVNAFHPRDFIKLEKDHPKLILVDFEIFDKNAQKALSKLPEIIATQTIIFYPSDRFFKLKFTLPTLEDINRTLYAWKIEGIDNDWNYQKENSLQFGALPYGDHRLLIKAQSVGGGWSPQELDIQIKVLKPFYLQPWFIAVAVFALLFSTFLFYKRKTRLIKERQQLLEVEIKNAIVQIVKDKKIIEKQSEELRQLDKVKSRFFANVSHELRTPLTLMLGPISSALKSGDLTNRNFTFLKKAQQSGKELLKLIGSLLDLSKMESGKMELNEQVELLFKLTRRLASAFESHAQRDGILFTYIYKAEKDLQVELDKEKVETILNNLLSNAIKFTTKGGKVNIRIEDLAKVIKISVADTGRGIHTDDLPHVFNRFFESTQRNAPTEGGTGIGLALSQELVHLMNGKIWVESEWGKGSTFFVEIPRKEVLGMVDNSNPKAEEVEVPLAEDGLAAKNSATDSELPTILIVEDNHSLRDYLIMILSSHYNVLVAENGRVALDLLTGDGGRRTEEEKERLEEGEGKTEDRGGGTEGISVADYSVSSVLRPPSLILSDIMMPVMDGYQLLKILKSEDDFRHIPVVVLTARADLRDKLKALRIGVDDYLLKPFDEEELLTRIENLLENHQERITAHSVTEEEDPSLPILSKEDEEWLRDIEQLLADQLSNSYYSIPQLAHDQAISERQLRRRLKQLTGLSPLHYIKEIRLQKARQLLEQKQYKTVAQTAAAVGFQNAATFSRNFYRLFGKMPSDYLTN
ncbi:MAG: signal transduction histidine kinase/CheY-like chemotaxis protein [Saprospiraceae bacterium]